MTVFDGTSPFLITLPITIRQMRAEDLTKLEWYGQFRHFRHVFRRSFQEQQTSGRRLLLVAEMNNFPIGRLFVSFRGKDPRLADGVSRGYLYSFSVMDMFQGQGIGTRLLLTAEQILRERQFHWATIAVAKDNSDALRLYRRHHYCMFAEDEGKWRYPDHRGILQHVHEPCWLLEKNLGARGTQA